MLTIMIFLCSTIGFEHLLVDPVAQRVGMGYAQIGDGYNVHYNPAGLSYTVAPLYTASYCQYIGGTHFGYLGVEKNQFGVGVRYFNSGNMKKTDALGQEYGTFGVHFIDLTVGKGFFYNDFGIGFSLKGLYARIDTLYSLGVGVDAGVLYLLSEPEIQVGIAVKNLGTGVKAYIEDNDVFPYEVNVSAMKYLPFGWVGFDLVKPALMDIGLRIGGCYTVFDNLEIKASYSTLYSSMQTGSSGLDFLAGIIVGFGVNINTFSIHYSYAPYFDLGGGHRLSLSLGG
jgi:hypothetical protein